MPMNKDIYMKGETPGRFLRIAFVMVMIILAFYFVSTRVALLLENPCWKKVITGLQPLYVKNYKQPYLSFNSQCLKKFVITTSKFTCSNACREDRDDAAASACAARCETEEDPVSFIIALPVEKTDVGRFLRGVSKLSFNWMSEGKPEVIRVPCTIENVIGIDECVETYGVWTCRPYEGGSAEHTFNLVLSEDGKVCTIEATLAAAELPATPGGGGDYGGSGAGGEE
jgi:hypothetical protein